MQSANQPRRGRRLPFGPRRTVAIAAAALVVIGLVAAVVGVILAACESDGVGEAAPLAQTLPPTTAATRPMTTSAAAAIATVLRGPKGRRRPRRGWFADCICASYRPRPFADVGRGSGTPRRPLRLPHVAGRLRRGSIGTLPPVRRSDRRAARGLDSDSAEPPLPAWRGSLSRGRSRRRTLHRGERGGQGRRAIRGGRGGHSGHAPPGRLPRRACVARWGTAFCKRHSPGTDGDPDLAARSVPCPGSQ